MTSVARLSVTTSLPITSCCTLALATAAMGVAEPPAESKSRPCSMNSGRAMMLVSQVADSPPGMVWIPAGEFEMGSTDPHSWPDEQPVHRVRVDGFWMDETLAYCKWAGKRPPTEAQWEFAAQRANIWNGRFPDSNSNDDDFARTAPVKSYPANGFGLYDMAGYCAGYRPSARMKASPDTSLAHSGFRCVLDAADSNENGKAESR